MEAAEVADTLALYAGQPSLERRLRHLRPHLTAEAVILLAGRAENEKLRNAQRALHLAEVAQAAADLLAIPEAEGFVPWIKGNAFFHLSRYDEALASYRRAEAFYTQQNQPLAALSLQINRLAVLQERGDYPAVLALAATARAAAEALGEAARPHLATLAMNVGSACQQMGEVEAALAAYESGRSIFIALGNQVEAARMGINRANVLEEMGRYSQANDLLQQARATLAAAGQDQEVARADLNLGLLAYRRGRYLLALNRLEAAHKGFAAIPNLVDLAVTDLLRANVYRALNLLQETIALAAAAETTFAANGMPWQQALALLLQAEAYRRLGLLPMAGRLLARARRTFQRQGAPARVLMADLDRAEVALAEGRVATARRLAGRLVRQLDAETWPSLTARGHLLLAQGAPDSGHAETALATATAHDLPELTIAAHAVLGQMRLATGDTAGAWPHFQAAISAIEQLRSGLRLDEFQAGFMEAKAPVFDGAIRLAHTAAAPARLLRLINSAHAAPLPNMAARLETGSGVPALREQWHWCQVRLEEAANARADSAPTAARLRQQQQDLEAEITEALRRQQVQAAGESDLSPGGAVAFTNDDGFLSAIQACLDASAALLHYYLVDGTLQALLVTQDTVHLVSNLAPAAPLQRALRAWQLHVDNTGLLSPSPAALRVAQNYLSHFYHALVRPLEPHLAGRSRLYLVLPPAWHPLPLAAFFDGAHYLVERFRLSYLSAPGVLLNLPDKRKAAMAEKTALIVGCSHDGQLPFALNEAAQVGKRLQHQGYATQLDLEEAATVARFRVAAPGSGLIHFATHATFRPDNPFFSWMRLADARLTVADLSEITLPRRPLVVLSACETGRGRPRGGGLMGMGRGFLAAGAAALLVSLWRVADASTAGFMADFYDHLVKSRFLALSDPDSSGAIALQYAQCAAIARDLHPFHWAGFIYIQG